MRSGWRPMAFMCPLKMLFQEILPLLSVGSVDEPLERKLCTWRSKCEASSDIQNQDVLDEAVARRSREETHAWAASRSIQGVLVPVGCTENIVFRFQLWCQKGGFAKRMLLSTIVNGWWTTQYSGRNNWQFVIDPPNDDEDISTKEQFLSAFNKLQDYEALDLNPRQEEENAGLGRYLVTVRSKLQFYSICTTKEIFWWPYIRFSSYCGCAGVWFLLDQLGKGCWLLC